MEVWIEILESLQKNKLRTFLTGFSVAWGIFILIILVSFGTGMKDFAEGLFGNDMNNTIYIHPNQTSLPYNGSNPGKVISFENKDLALLTSKMHDIDIYSARLNLNSPQIKYKNEKGSFNIRCVHPDHRWIEGSKLLKGRFINSKDQSELRKCVVIGISAKESLFGRDEAIGKHIEINKVSFKVVGIHTDESEEGEKRTLYLPVNTAQDVFNDGEHISTIVITVNNPSLKKGEEATESIKTLLGDANNFNPKDDRALYINNKLKDTERIFQLLDSIKVFTIFIGILSIISGSIGVMNIMVISVKERTKEIGLRRALGAEPKNIIFSIIQESVFITVFFGYLGLLSGAVILFLINSFVGEESSFKNLLLDLPLALLATFVLVLVGVISGLFPALKASKTRPVEALNNL